MRTIALVARGELTYNGRAVVLGEVFEATPVDAAVLRYHRKVDFAPRGVRPSPPTIPAPPSDPPRLSPETRPLEELPCDEPEKPVRRRRTYARRDLEAEE